MLSVLLNDPLLPFMNEINIHAALFLVHKLGAYPWRISIQIRANRSTYRS